MKSYSLARRTTLTVLLIELLCALAFMGTDLWHESQIRFHALDEMLQGRSDSLIGAVQDAEDPGDNVKVDPAEFKLPRGDAYAVYNPNGSLVGSAGDLPLIVMVRGTDGFHNASANGHRYRVLQRNALRIIDREETAGVGLRRPVTVIYAVRADHIWHEVFEAVRFHLLGGLLLLGLTALALVYFLRRLLDPLKQLAQEAAGIEANALHFQPPASALPIRELQPMAEALSQTVDRLRAAFDAQHRFISDAAHELKTAVAVVRSTVQVMAIRPRSSEEYRQGLEQVLSDNDRVEALVARMLTLARFDERSDATAAEIDLAAHVQSAVQMLASYAEDRHVRLRVSLAPEIRLALRAEALEALVSNVVMNAIQHSKEGDEVEVSTRREEGTDRPIIFAVQDFGDGIAPDQLPHVFERFFRADPSRSRATGGFGLGLAICKSIVERAGGTIRVQSELGKGTTVTAAFPAR